MSVKNKVIIIAIVTVIAVTGIGVFAYSKLNKTSEVSASIGETSNKLAVEEEPAPTVKEEVIAVSNDLSPAENNVAEENKEEVVEFKDKKVVVPKSTVAAVNSAEDAERNKKNGGDNVNQTQANEMFQNE